MSFRPRIPVPALLLLATTATPADAGLSVLSGLTHEQRAEAGDSYDGEVLIANDSDRPTQVKVYQTDYSFDADGTAAYDEIGSVPRSSGHWVVLRSPGIITLAAHQKAAIPYTVAVPAASELAGTYWSVLMVEQVPSIVLEAEPTVESSLGIKNVLRYAIQLVTHVGDGGEEDFSVAAMRLEASDAQHLGFLHVDLQNIGEVLLRADLRFELFDLEGRAIGVFLSGRKRLYSTTSVRFDADLSRVPVGSYKLLMMVRLATGFVHASEYKLEPST